MSAGADAIDEVVLRVIRSCGSVTRPGLWAVVPVRAACVAEDRHSPQRRLAASLQRLRVAGMIRYCRQTGWRMV